MALTQAQVDALSTYSERYDQEHPSLSFVDWLTQQGQGQLVADLVSTLEANGDTATLQAIRETPPAAPHALTPEESWAKYAQPADVPPQGQAWGLDSGGKWRLVPVAPGGKFVGGHYIPPQRPGGPREPAAADVRFSDPKRIAATATALAADWSALFFDVAPRGATSDKGLTPGIGTIDQGTDYAYEGGSIYPQISHAEAPGDWPSIASQATALHRWWDAPPWPDFFTSSRSLAWYRVYTDAQGYRAYRQWTLAELQAFRLGFMLGVSGFECLKAEVMRDASNDIACKVDTHGAPPLATVLSLCEIFPLAQCSISASVTHRRNLKIAAAIAGAVVAAVFLPALAPKLAASLHAIAGKIGGAIAGAVNGSKASAAKGASAAQQAVSAVAQHVADRIVGPPAPQEQQGPPAPNEQPPSAPPAAASGMPAPPTNATSADFQAYATAIAQWYQEQLSQQQAQASASLQAANAAAAAAKAPTDAAAAAAQLEAARAQQQAMQQQQQTLANEVARIGQLATQVAAGTLSPDQAALQVATTDAPSAHSQNVWIAAAAGAAFLALMLNQPR